MLAGIHRRGRVAQIDAVEQPYQLPRIVDACERDDARVFYPALYDVAGRVPGLAARVTRAANPSPLA